ncbi:MAG: hypothetical protein JW863_17925 [Chitinispirillaceae bacterium]|nr:hypothetical protein [Chitinispirillaceae bacterium]
MVNRQHKKTAPKVRNGKVQKKNNRDETPSYWNTSQKIPVIDKEPAGRGYKHFLRKKDILDFIEIIPDWEEMSEGLNGILLAHGHPSADGFHSSYHGVIQLCAWERDKWTEFTVEGYREHKELLQRLGVVCEKKPGYYLCKFDEKQIKAYLLLHVFLHELGHHYDKMTTRKKTESSRGEPFAESYALKYEKEITKRYFERFDD